MGLTKPSGGGGEYAVLTRRSWATKGRIVRDPIPHHDPATRASHAHHFLRDVERPWRKHRAEDRHDQVEAVVREAGQVRRIALLKTEVGKPEALRPSIARGDEVACNVDAEHVRSELCLRHRSGAVSATEIEDIEPRRDSQAAGESLTALAHRGRDPREVTLLP
jgi:hypothetical protein